MRPAGPSTKQMAGVALVAGFVLVWLGRGLTFYWDEWDFIAHRSLGDPATWLTPHNEHLVLLPVLLYRAMVETIGIGSYVPYLAVVAALHVVVVLAVYRLVRDATRNELLATAAGIVASLFGSGFENLFWGFQIGFVGATALCLWALVALRPAGDEPLTRTRVAIAVALLTAAVATAGIAIAFIAGIGIELLLDRRRRRFVLFLALPVLVWLVWWLAVGRTGGAFSSYVIGLDTPLVIGRVVLAGLSSAAGAVFGLGPQFGGAAAAAVFAVAVVRWRQGRLGPEVLGPAVAIVVLYGILGLTRGAIEPEVANNPRFTYESGMLLIVAVAALIGRDIRLGRARTRVIAQAAAGAIFVVALAYNTRLLIQGREVMFNRADLARALVTVALDPNRPSGVDPQRSLLVVTSPARLEQVVARYASPLTDTMAPDAVRPIPPDILDDARTWLIDGPPPGITGGSW